MRIIRSSLAKALQPNQPHHHVERLPGSWCRWTGLHPTPALKEPAPKSAEYTSFTVAQYPNPHQHT